MKFAVDRQHRLPLFVFIVGVMVAISATLLLAIPTLDPPAEDMALLALFLSGSGALTIFLAYILYRLGLVSWFQSLRWALVATIGITVLLIFINVWVTAQLMFLDAHDLTLNTLLLVFAGLTAIAFGYFISSAMIENVQKIAQAANRLSQGDLSVRIPVTGNDELADLARAFNNMATNLQELDEQKRQLEQTRRDLIAWVSHDLRTPLATMRAMIEAISDGVVSDEETISRYMKNTQGEIKHLSQLIDDLFELAQLDAGHYDFTREPSSLSDLISDTLESMRAQIAAHNINLTGKVDGRIDPVLMAPEKIQRVLYNLISNAIRHTPPGGEIQLNARLAGNAVRIDIRDSGEGVKPEELPRIFERFYRGESARTRDGKNGQRGVGLGLAIVRGLVEAHEGKIWVESKPGEGATFSFTLPLAS
ncbi:MAG TPA: ATP-binding protein [Aggregatilineales bacterium]|nr:ATP-binding protein [Aggregatilineales bacterium]